jgi:predicted kinase
MAYGNFGDAPGALIILSGLPGTGKTTFAQALSKVLDFAHIESDAIRRAVAPVPLYSTAESGVVFRQVEADARAALAAGRHALIDATNLTHRDRKRFLKLAEVSGARLVAVRLVAPVATIRERLSRPRDGHSQATFEIYEQMRHRSQPFAGAVLVVDTRFDLGPALRLTRDVAEGHLSAEGAFPDG